MSSRNKFELPKGLFINIDVVRQSLEGLEISSVDDTWVKIRDIIKASAKEKVGILETIRN